MATSGIRTPLAEYLSHGCFAGRSGAYTSIATLVIAANAITVYRLLHDGDLLGRAKRALFANVRRIGIVRNFIQKKIDEAAKEISFPSGGTYTNFHELPAKGLADDDLLQLSTQLHSQLDKSLTEEILSGVVYVGSHGKTDVVAAVMKQHLWANPLFADYFGATRKMEAEIIEIMIHLFNGRTRDVPAAEQQVGCYTFGGTESVLMAMLAMRNYAQAVRGIRRPNVIVPTTAHPAFDKAAAYFGIRIVKVPPTPGTFAVSVDEVAKHITYETIGLVGSAPAFAHGTIDPIAELSELALQRGLLLHVDACLGGMAIQFMERAGIPQPIIDFRRKGVTSISCDIHKWGGSPKGASCVLYRGAWLRQHQTFTFADYPGGLYVTPSINGSKAGYVIAGAWATLLATGREEYTDNVRRVVTATRAFQTAIESMPLLHVLGRPQVTTVAFSSHVLDIYQVKTNLAAKGWLLNPLQFPPGVHLGVTLEHTKPGALALLITDLAAVVEGMARELGFESAAAAEAAYQRGDLVVNQKHVSLVYGSTQAVPDRSIIAQVLAKYVDGYYVNDGDNKQQV